ncbi:hypothetical protein FOA52_009353 [Chlamydomonas sp. UWO 241]|nr:hypothetical protein FOA52_009353 [Chlamydomonas sp. UWO 241]
MHLLGRPPPQDAPPPSVAELEAMAPDARAEAEAAAAARIERGRRRVAAATLLQRRLPPLLVRKHAIDAARASAARAAPWLARLAAVLGMVAAGEGRAFLARRAAERAAADAAAADAASAARQADGAAATFKAGKPEAPGARAKSPTKPPSARGGSKSPSRTPPPAPLPAPAEGGGGEPDVGLDLADSPPMQSLRYLERACTLAARGRAWHEGLNAARALWNVTRMLLNMETGLSVPTPPLVWLPGPMPGPPEAPPSTIAAAVVEKGAKGKDAKKDDSKKDSKAGKAGAEPAAPAPPTVPLPTNARANTGRALRAATDALLSMVAALRAGTPLHAGVVPLPSVDGRGEDGDGGGDFDDAASYATSNFSYGSDLQADEWFRRVPLDMAFLNRLVLLVLTVLGRMRRWHAVLSLGEEWLALSEGAFNEKVLPVLMAAAAETGAPSARMQATMEAVMRDKNQALDNLDSVRALAKKRLGEASVLAGSGVGSNVRKKKGVRTGRAGPGGAPAADSDGEGLAFGDNASTAASSYTNGTSTTFRTRASQPDHARVPGEYEKVIEFLKKRGEKGAMILAMNEMGDVHAHFGNWRAATTAWSDALDTLLGPYQVIRSWRKVLDAQSKEATLKTLGVHGILLASGVLLGKLARYAYHGNLGLRLEAARMGATLVSCLFVSSIQHPQRPAGFATYVPLSLWDGADVFADPYRCPLSDVLSGLETLASTLIDVGLALDALPLLSAWECIAWRCARSVPATVRCRTLRVRALVQLGLLTAASELLLDLLAGRRLPDPLLDSDLRLRDPITGAVVAVAVVPPLRADALPGHADNQPAIAALGGDGVLPAAVEALYGPWAVAHLALARADLLLRLGSVPNLWKETSPGTGLRVQPAGGAGAPAPAAGGRGGGAGAGGNTAPPAAAAAAAGAGAKGAAAAGAKGGAKAAEKPASGRGGRAGSPGPDAAPDPTVAPDPTAAAQRGEVLVRALLLLTDVELARWAPASALAHAARALSCVADGAERVNASLSDNDECERFGMAPALWLLARSAMVRCTYQLGHDALCERLVSAGLAEASAAGCALSAAGLLHVQAALLVRRGDAAGALNTLQDVLSRYQALVLRDPRVSSLLLDAAAARDDLGLRGDAERLAQAATAMLEEWCSSLGLNEAREHAELINVYASGTALYAAALQLVARCAARHGPPGLPDAQASLEDALLLLRRFTRALPAQHARAALALARVVRMRAEAAAAGAVGAVGSLPPATTTTTATAPPTSGGEGGQGTPGALLVRARELLEQALTLATLDGGHRHGVLREALLELGSQLVAPGGEAGLAGGALRSAYSAASQLSTVTLASHTLQPVAVAQLPEWALAFARGQEAAFVATAGKGAGAGAGAEVKLSDAALGRKIMCNFVGLCRPGGPPPPASDASRLDTQQATLHMALKAACPRYASGATFGAAVPLPPPAGAPTPPPGTVVVQWLVHTDGTPREAGSWAPVHQSLPAVGVTQAQVLGLRPVSLFVSMLFLVVPSPGTTGDALPALYLGERTFPLEAVRGVLASVKALRHRMECPRVPTDLFGDDAPSGAELARLRARVERVLSARRVSVLGRHGGRAGTSASDGDDGSEGDDASGLAETSEGEGGGAGAQAAPDGPAVDQAFLTKLEGMLDTDNGLDLVDAAFAGWLGRLLLPPPQ